MLASLEVGAQVKVSNSNIRLWDKVQVGKVWVSINQVINDILLELSMTGKHKIEFAPMQDLQICGRGNSDS